MYLVLLLYQLAKKCVITESQPVREERENEWVAFLLLRGERYFSVMDADSLYEDTAIFENKTGLAEVRRDFELIFLLQHQHSTTE